MTIASTTEIHRYDDFSGNELDPEKWTFLQYPLPDGSTHICAEPNAEGGVGGGAYRVRIECFENNHGVQIIDNPKHLAFSTQAFELPEHGESRFSITMSALGINTAPHDYRDGFAAFNVLDLANGWVFDVAASSDTIFAIHERLPFPGVDKPFTHCVDAPLSGIDTTPGAEHRYTVCLDRGARTASWEVDGHIIFQLADTVVPERVQVGFGVFTLHPVQNDSSVSLRGQGLDATWRDLSIEIFDGA